MKVIKIGNLECFYKENIVKKEFNEKKLMKKLCNIETFLNKGKENMIEKSMNFKKYRIIIFLENNNCEKKKKDKEIQYLKNLLEHTERFFKFFF